ncbi:glycosyltransferase family 4 protein [Sphingomonas sp. OTU376]|uniref:glycosyltransferase family 4 protein n=1 Tax=Sphingomonas sp. OTU376 TaxID=3043863 RepID=UPI00313E5281
MHGLAETSSDDPPPPRRRVLLLAYMISPRRGSEYSVTWNHIQAMKKWCDITLLYGTSGPHMGDDDDMAAVRDVLDKDVDYVFVQPPRLASILNRFNRKGFLLYSFYLAYAVWHREAGRVARRLCAERDFDLVHYLGPIGYREPGHLWKLDKPYVWGPIGGATNFPWQLRRAMPASGLAKLSLRAMVNGFQLRFSGRVRKALKRADFLFTATSENQAIFKRIHGVSSRYMPENGIVGPLTLDTSKFPAKPIRVAWIGSIEARKGLPILLGAIGQLKDRHAYHFDIIGDGPMKASMQEAAIQAGIDDVITWHGQIPRETVSELFRSAHLHVVTGLNEGNPTTIWEAMENCVPLMALDHCGMHDTVGGGYGIKLPVESLDAIERNMAEALEALAERPEKLREMAEACARECTVFRWDSREKVILEAYEAAIATYHAKGR